MAEIAKLLAHVAKKDASDLHLSAGTPPLMRHLGQMVPVTQNPLASDVIERLIKEIMTDEQWAEFLAKNQIDFAVSIEGVSRFRVNAFRQHRGAAAVFRVVKSEVPTLEKLNLPKVLTQLVALERGLILVTGPTGSGKSTTLAAMVDYLNTHRSGHIITIEDPIEFVHPNKKCLVNQREIGTHAASFADALRAALREDPDIILLGELRDLETIDLAVTAAETGHMVFGTLHTNSAAKAIDRIINTYPADEQAMIRAMISESLRGVIAQELLPKADGSGRVAALEILISTPAVRNIIRENKIFQLPTVMQTNQSIGMQSMKQVLENLAMTRVITQELAKEKLASLG
ncbi:MAG: type IV pilus twitching motility protein PilT [Deltaproteobacteria bacterium]|nr:type IV pilus twitching motility protein PilT [Deltaproteobacteria bacterium]MCB9487261.1 type IV pilus twitching motility protein PilT [Deltaproteobacteria bacterium]